MKCPYCNGSGWDDEHMIKCLKCDNGIIEPTHQEYMQNCTTEELVEEIIQWWTDGAYSGVGEFGLKQKWVDEKRAEIVEWLKEKKE